MSQNIPKKYEDASVFKATVNYFSILTIKDIEIAAESILNLHIYEWIFELTPRIDIVLNDNGVFNEKYPLVDNDKIQIELGINDETENTFNVTFILKSFTIENSNSGENSTSIMRIMGVMENDQLFFPIKSRSFQNMPSVDVIEKIATETGFTADIRIQTPDNMTWLQAQLSNDMMIKDVMDRAFFAENDTVFCYSNRNKEMVYTSLQTEVLKSDSFLAIFSEVGTSIQVDIPEKNRSLKDGRDLLVFNNIEYKNLAPTINKLIYYGAEETHYDGNDKVTVLVNSDVHTLSTLSLKDSTFAGQIVHSDTYGIHNNVHENYFRSLTENKYIKEGFFCSPIMIVTKPNINLNLFDKVDLMIQSQDGLSINDVLSGKYLVGGIVHHVSNKGIYTTLVTLFRNGIEPPTFDKDLTLNLTKN